jgi:hypothetical protein
MQVRDVIALIEADGWKMVRQKGSRRQYRHLLKPERSPWPGTRAWTRRQAAWPAC